MDIKLRLEAVDFTGWEGQAAGVDDLDLFICVRHYKKVYPWKESEYTCDSDTMFYGYTECDWHIVECFRVYEDKTECGLDINQVLRMVDHGALEELIVNEIERKISERD